MYCCQPRRNNEDNSVFTCAYCICGFRCFQQHRAWGGLSGWQGLSCSEVLKAGQLRLGTEIEYLDTDNGSILTVPLQGCWGAAEDIELAAVLPFVPADDAFDGSFIGDMTLAGGWLYETTRGGTALKLTCRLTLPTGEEFRDTGAELAVGGVTSTTFLDFRLSMAGEYALNGQCNPFHDEIVDVFHFTGGGSSYISSDFLISAALNGSTSGEFRAIASAEYLLDESLAANGGFSLGLNDFENFGLHAGIAWTGEGF